MNDPRLLDFIKRITAHVDPEIESMGAPFRHASRIRVRTRSGRQFEKLSLHRRGSPENPLSAGDIESKFRNVVAPCLDKAAAERIVDLVRRFDTLDTLDELIAAVGTAIDPL